ncbi:hypothetical protein GCM10023085_67240 [Actinomadura viridis]|uniref:Uncharacterized protein n=1 Tax=Actinomadura viridis TaxID=58110 RepID=A0A931GLI6_9ACTN|nr:hypothetical protein [Actinomadura viridis]MBG6091547.1 hypothetical protein [Actinomadura viridis]
MTYFVYRTHYEGPLSKRVRRLPDASVLDWFRRGWTAVVDGGQDAWRWVDDDLGGEVYGLASVFEAARVHAVKAPRTWRELRDVLQEHLYVEGEVLVGEHGVRALTDDDEVVVPYFFFDDVLVEAHPDRLAYLLHDAWPLPEDAVENGDAVESGEGAGRTTALLLTHYDGDSICWQPPFVFEGVRLPELAERLRTAGEGMEDWPQELRVLRALVAPADGDIGDALRRCNLWPDYESMVGTQSLLGAHPEVHAQAMDVVARQGGLPSGRDPGRTLISVGEHLAQAAMHMCGTFGFQQWFLFDDLWERRHEDLSRSLIHYAADWDPLAGLDTVSR